MNLHLVPGLQPIDLELPLGIKTPLFLVIRGTDEGLPDLALPLSFFLTTSLGTL